MRTIKNIQQRLKAIETERDRLRERWQTDPEVKRLKTAHDKRRDEVWKEDKPQLDNLLNERIKLEAEIKNIRATKKAEPIVSTPKGEAWFKHYCNGKDGGRFYSLIWASPTGRFLIVKQPGGMYWSGRGAQSYAQTQFGLHDINKNEWLGGEIMVHRGRLTKEVFKEMKNKAVSLENAK